LDSFVFFSLGEEEEEEKNDERECEQQLRPLGKKRGGDDDGGGGPPRWPFPQLHALRESNTERSHEDRRGEGHTQVYVNVEELARSVDEALTHSVYRRG
jgi:hypothetical protein